MCRAVCDAKHDIMKTGRIIAGAFLLSCFGTLHAQQRRAVELSTAWNERILEINAKVNEPGSYTLFLQFTSLQNTSQSPTYVAVVRGSQKVLSVRPTNPEEYPNVQYRYWHMRGYAPTKLDTTFVYRLPCSVQKKVQAFHLYNLRERHFGGEAGKNWSCYQLQLERGDTVYAARKGRVVEIKDGHESTTSGATYRSEYNHLLIEHGDGTLAQYEVLQNGSMMVKVNDVVYPDTPIALAGSYDGSEYQVRFLVYYPVADRNFKGEGHPFSYTYVTPWFQTVTGAEQLQHGQAYFGTLSGELVEREMTKKEIKDRASRQ